MDEIGHDVGGAAACAGHDRSEAPVLTYQAPKEAGGGSVEISLWGRGGKWPEVRPPILPSPVSCLASWPSSRACLQRGEVIVDFTRRATTAAEPNAPLSIFIYIYIYITIHVCVYMNQ